MTIQEPLFAFDADFSEIAFSRRRNESPICLTFGYLSSEGRTPSRAILRDASLASASGRQV